MSTSLVAILVGVGLVVAWFAYSIRWANRQSLLGIWVAVLPDGSRVSLQFEGEAKGGIYKQLAKRDGVEVREFGHWTIKLLDLRLIIMATDVKDHPRFGVDTQYWVSFNNGSEVKIEGPDRPKWVFRKAAEVARLNFDLKPDARS
ncbi:MAG: hypothetical protein HZA92_06995 [Verrucomicrobia bacterium]|nr:hypothetical protein [Verrucomicrobiota bacterium]